MLISLQAVYIICELQNVDSSCLIESSIISRNSIITSHIPKGKYSELMSVENRLLSKKTN